MEIKTKRKGRNNNAKRMPEKNRRKVLDRESLVKCQPRATDTLPGSQPCTTQTHSIYNFVLSGFQVSLSAQSTSLSRESLGWFNQRGSKTSQACYSHLRCNLNLVRLFCFSLPRPLLRLLFLFLLPRSPLHVLFYRSSAAVLQSPVMAKSRRSSIPRSPSIISPSLPAHVFPLLQPSRQDPLG